MNYEEQKHKINLLREISEKSFNHLYTECLNNDAPMESLNIILTRENLSNLSYGPYKDLHFMAFCQGVMWMESELGVELKVEPKE